VWFVMSKHVHLVLGVDKDKAMSYIQTFHYFVLFLIKEDEIYLEISV
jgi:hypothetical protein